MYGALLRKPTSKGLFSNIILRWIRPTPKIYRTTNWSSYNCALINRGNSTICLILKPCKYGQFSLQRIISVIRKSLGDLLDPIPLYEQIVSVYTDGAYDTKQCRHVIADWQAHAVIPPRKNAKPWKDNKVHSRERNELLWTVKRFGKTLWKKWSDYYCRSLVETKMHSIKWLGDKLSARNFQSQVNEVHARIAILNKFTELGRPHTQVFT